MENDTLSQSPENSGAYSVLLQIQNFCISLSLSRQISFFLPCSASDVSQKALAPFHTVMNCTASDCTQVTIYPGKVAMSVRKMASLCRAWVSRRKPSTVPSFQFSGSLGLVWWDSSSPLPFSSSNRSQNSQELVQQARQFPLWMAVILLSWFLCLRRCSQLSSLFYSSSAFLRFQRMRGCENTNCIWKCQKGIGCSGSFRNIILKQKHILVLWLLILATI